MIVTPLSELIPRTLEVSGLLFSGVREKLFCMGINLVPLSFKAPARALPIPQSFNSKLNSLNFFLKEFYFAEKRPSQITSLNMCIFNNHESTCDDASQMRQEQQSKVVILPSIYVDIFCAFYSS